MMTSISRREQQQYGSAELSQLHPYYLLLEGWAGEIRQSSLELDDSGQLYERRISDPALRG
jgi:hypothetical protein